MTSTVFPRPGHLTRFTPEATAPVTHAFPDLCGIAIDAEGQLYMFHNGAGVVATLNSRQAAELAAVLVQVAERRIDIEEAAAREVQQQLNRIAGAGSDAGGPAPSTPSDHPKP